MAYSKIEQRVWQMAESIAQEKGCYLYDVEYLKEGGIWFLRVYVDKEEGGISLDECEAVSRALSEVLDKEDPIDRNYYLEVSSPGVERKLKTAAHFARYQGAIVDVGLYKAINGSKLLTGILKGFDGEMITLEVGGELLEVLQKETTVVHLHFDFS
ncbi:MAG: ribosome maturation factor RimP [Clostridia bacterium]|nr:ribosome maturation factor RimP [Clostridia bacterium]